MGKIAILALVACVIPQAGVQAQRASAQRIVYPQAPDTARIEYAGSLRSDEDLGGARSFLSRMRASITGESGTASTMLRSPHDVYVDEAGRWWVTDMGRRQVLRFDPRRKDGHVMGSSRGESALVTPLGITGDRRGSIYVADGGRHHVAVLDTSGRTVRFVGKGVLLNPTDVAWDAARNRLYVADSYLHQVVVFGATGQVLRRIGRQTVAAAQVRAATVRIDTVSRGAAAIELAGHDASSNRPSDIVEHRGAAPGEFRYPAFLALSPGGRLYVSDQMNFRVQEFDTAGVFVRSIGQLGSSPGTFSRPKGIATDSRGNLYVADAAFNNIQIFNPRGELLLFFPDDGGDAAQLAMPMGMFIDSRDRILVADKRNGRVQSYQLLKP